MINLNGVQDLLMKIETVYFIVKHSQVGCTENFETKREEGTGFFSSVNFTNYS